MAFSTDYGLFKVTHENTIYPNPAASMLYDNHLMYFEFLGKILGKALFEKSMKQNLDSLFSSFGIHSICKIFCKKDSWED